MSFRADNSRPPIGIDLGKRRIKAVQLRRQGGAWRIDAAASMPREDPAAPIGPAEVGHLGELLRKQGFKGSTVVLAVPSEHVMSGILELPPRQSGAPVEQLARAELARMHRREAGSFEMVCWDLPAPERAANTTFVMAVACSHDSAEQLLEAFEGQGFCVRGLDVHASAAARACEGLLRCGRGIAGILDVGYSAARLVLWYGEVVVYERRLPKGGLSGLVGKLTGELHLPADEVERVLTDSHAPHASAGPSLTVAAAAKGYFDTLIEEMRTPLSYLANQYPGARVERLLLVGGGAQVPGLKEHLAGALALDVRVVLPSDLAVCPPALNAEYGPTLAVAVGLGQFAER